MMFQFLAIQNIENTGCRRSLSRHLLHRLTILAISLVVVVTTQVLYKPKLNAQSNDRSNIVVIMADDLGYRDLGCYGCIDFETPHIDALAERGVRCSEGYVSHPYCSPSRAGLLTGKYQQRFGHEHNPPYREDDGTIGIDAETQLLPEVLQKHGYATGLIGKWHLGAGEPFRPARRGFDEFYGFLGGGHHYFRALPDGTNYNSPMWRNDHPTDDELTYLTDDLTAEAERFIERHRSQPFCLLLMYNAPHAPDHVTERYMQRVAGIQNPKRRRYAALVQGVDEGVGRVVAKLEELELTRETLVVFLSDNGGRRGVSDNRPLRGNKGWLHEGGIRVPFIFSMPGTLPGGQTYRRPIIALDVLPTALRLAGLNLPPNLDGVDLLPFLMGSQTGPPHDTLCWRVSGGEGYAIRDRNWKLVHDIGMEQPQLYDLSVDGREDHDVSGEYPRKLNELLKRYQKWDQKLETPRWVDSHSKHVREERAAARRAGARQYPMPWVQNDN